MPFEPPPVVTMYTCGITPYDSAHLGHAAVYLDLRRAPAPAAGPRAPDPVRAQRHRRRRRHPAQGPRARACTTWTWRPRRWPASTPTWRRIGLLRHLRRAPGHLGHPRDPLADRHLAGAGPRLPGRRGRLLRRLDLSPTSASSATSTATHMLALAADARRQPRRPEQARPARLRAVAAVAARRAELGVALGPGPAGLAHRVLGPGPARAGRDHRHPRRGRDLVFPHHECEQAQSESATGKPFVRHWMHVGLVGLGGEKMSKSLGNLVFVGDLVKKWRAGRRPPGPARAPLPPRLGVDRGRHARGHRPPGAVAVGPAGPRRPAGPDPMADAAVDLVRERLDDDLDTPGALDVIDEAPAAGHPVSRAAATAGRQPSDRHGAYAGAFTAAMSRRCTRGEAAMAGIVKVRLPDGSDKELAEGATALRPGGGHRAPPGQGRPGRPGGRPTGGPLDRAARRGRGGRGHRRVRRRARGAAALHRPRAGPGGVPAVAGRPLRHRPGHRGRLLLRLRAARRGPVQRRGPRAHRGHHARRSSPRTSRSSATSTRWPRAWPSSPTSPSSARSSRRWRRGADEVDAGPAGTGDGAGRRPARGLDLLELPRVHRPVPRAPTSRPPPGWATSS